MIKIITINLITNASAQQRHHFIASTKASIIFIMFIEIGRVSKTVQ